jgi:hypothetical protein
VSKLHPADSCAPDAIGQLAETDGPQRRHSSEMNLQRKQRCNTLRLPLRGRGEGWHHPNRVNF